MVYEDPLPSLVVYALSLSSVLSAINTVIRRTF